MYSKSGVTTCGQNMLGEVYPLASLFGIILFTILVSFLTVLIVSHITGKTLVESLKLDPTQGLSRQALFWLSVILPVSLFIVTGGFAWSGCSVNVSSTGFKNFLTISQLPLGLLATCLPLGLMVTRMHGTKQTAIQIGCSEKALQHSEKLEVNRQRERDAERKQAYRERTIQRNTEAMEKLKGLAIGTLSEIELHIKRFESCPLTGQRYPIEGLSFNSNEKYMDSMLDYMSLDNWPIERIVQAAKYIQAADITREHLIRELKADMEKEYALSEHLYLVNATWLEFTVPAKIVYQFCNKLRSKGQVTIDGIEDSLLDKNTLREVVTYIAIFERWQNDGGRTYFGFVV